MKITKTPDMLWVDVQSRRAGNSAVLTAKDDATEVYFGHLHATVTLRDLRIRVIMNPDEGRWDDLAWARSKAMDVICDRENIAVLLSHLCALNHQVGRSEGRRELQHQLAKLLGR